MPKPDEEGDEIDVGDRTFRRLVDGRILEVMADGTTRSDFDIEGRHFDSDSADFRSIRRAYYGREVPVPEPKPEVKPAVKPPELTFEERMRAYLAAKRGYVGVDMVKVPEQPVSVFLGSVRALLNDAPKGHGLGGFHPVGGSHSLPEGTKLTGSRPDPLKKIYERSKQRLSMSEGKARTYSEHISKVYGSEKGDILGNRTAITPHGGMKTGILTRRIRVKGGK